MRICYFADGRTVHTQRWMKYFSSVGHEMHLISFAPMSDQDNEALAEIGVKVHGDIGNFHVKRFWLTFDGVKFLRRVLRSERIDILNSHFLGTNAWYAAMSRFHPHVITVMGGGDVTGVDWKPNGNAQSRILTPLALRNADYITSWSRLMADAVAPYCKGTPIEVVHGGIHLERFFPGERPAYLLERFNLPEDAKVVFSPRLMRPLSNVVEVARAAQIIEQRSSNTYYLVAFPATVVDEEYGREVKRLFEEGVGADKVRFISEIPHHEIPDYFRLADVTISIPDTDGTPMTVLESMACGTPTVIGNLPDYDKEYFEDEKTTLMVNVKDPKSIAVAISRLLTDQETAASIATEARRRVLETGGYEYQMSKMEKIYERVAG